MWPRPKHLHTACKTMKNRVSTGVVNHSPISGGQVGFCSGSCLLDAHLSPEMCPFPSNRTDNTVSICLLVFRSLFGIDPTDAVKTKPKQSDKVSLRSHLAVNSQTFHVMIISETRPPRISPPSQNCRILQVVQSFTVHHLDQDSGPAAHIPIRPIHPIPPTSFTSAWPTSGVMCIKVHLVHCWDIVLAKVFRSKITFGPI